MVLLDPIIFVAATPMLDSLARHFRDCSWIRAMPVGGDLFGMTTGYDLGAAEEALGGGPVALWAQHRIHQVAIPVDGAIQIHPPPTHLEIYFIHMPAATDSALPSTPNLVSRQGSKPRFSVPYRFITEGITTNQKQRHEITQTQFEQ